MRTTLVAISVGALLAVAGCKKKELPAQIPYKLNITFAYDSAVAKPAHPAAGATVFRDGKELGKVEIKDRNVPYDFVYITEPSSNLPSTWGPLELHLPTPCGDKVLPLELSKSNGGYKSETEKILAALDHGQKEVELFVDGKSAPPKVGQLVTIKWGTSKDPLMIGKLAIPPGTSEVAVFDSACAPEIPLRIGDNTFGKLDTSLAYGFILAQVGTCFAVETIAYGSAAVAGGGPEIVKAPHYEIGTLDFYLTKPSSTATTAVVGEKETYRRSVQNATCPAT